MSGRHKESESGAGLVISAVISGVTGMNLQQLPMMRWSELPLLAVAHTKTHSDHADAATHQP